MAANEGEVLSPLFKSPPFKISPGLLPTPGKLSVLGGVPFVRNSVLVFKVNELPGKFTVPVTAGDRTRVLFSPFPTPVPLNTNAQAIPAMGATAVPVPLVFQMA